MNKLKIRIILRDILLFILVSFASAVALYVVFALVYSTPLEKKLKKENQLYRQIVPDVRNAQNILVDRIALLQYMDVDVYNKIFQSQAPTPDPFSSLSSFNTSRHLPESRLEKYVRDKSDLLLEKSASIDSTFERIFIIVSDRNFVCPPMELPVKNLEYTQVGAGIGKRFNRFYKIETQHNGVDFIVQRGTPVYAPASGIVKKVESNKTQGNTLTIGHAGGYETFYANLDEVFVKSGQSVKKGVKVASSGMSGHSFIPHLHYEVYCDGVLHDPVNHIFRSVTPAEYANMLFMSVNTKQSMD